VSGSVNVGRRAAEGVRVPGALAVRAGLCALVLPPLALLPSASKALAGARALHLDSVPPEPQRIEASDFGDVQVIKFFFYGLCFWSCLCNLLPNQRL
jgi:hypothetical protein